MQPGSKLALGESHRLIVSALLRGLEDMSADVERWMDPRPGALFRIEEPLSASEEERLKILLDRMGQELRRVQWDFALDISGRSAIRSIEALLIEHLSLLEETASGELQGYGRIEEPAFRQLAEAFASLRRILEEMMTVVRRKAGKA